MCGVALEPASAEASPVTVKFDGTARLKIDTYGNPFFNLAQAEDFTSYQYRLTAGWKALHRSGWSVYGQIGVYDEDGRSPGPRSVDRNDGDLLQGYAEYSLAGEDWTFLARAGRQRNPQGASRLNASREAPNAARTFDGLSFSAETGRYRVSAFALRPVQLQFGIFDDRTNSAETFWGSYLTVKEIRPDLDLDLYYFGRRDETITWSQGTGEEMRHSVGGRIFGRLGPGEINLEAIRQYGDFDGADLEAWGIAMDGSLPVAIPGMDARIGVRGNAVSGDRDQTDNTLGTFSAIYPRTSYYSDAVTFAPSNSNDLQFYVQSGLTDTFSVEAFAGRIWRRQSSDAIYRVPYTVLVEAGTPGGDHVADLYSLSADWDVSQHIFLSTSYVHGARGGLIRASGGESFDYGTLTVSVAF